MSIPQYKIEFTRDGQVYDDASFNQLLNDLPEYTDLFVVSHGWNNDMADAGKLYDDLFTNIAAVMKTGTVNGIEGRRFGALRVFWPSKRFAEKDLIPGGGAASLAQPESDAALLRMLDALTHNPLVLGGMDVDPVRSVLVKETQALVPDLDDAVARREFAMRLRTILDPSSAHADDGSVNFFTADPEELFAMLSEPVVAPPGPSAGGAASLDGAGAAVGLTDTLSGFKAAARRLVNYTTYYEMKHRAGMVGVGLAQTLRHLRRADNTLSLHLVGHSFGARLVTAAAHAFPEGTPKVSLSLLQAAFSHNGFASQFDGTNDGAFRALLSEKRASGPIIITHTKNDQAVGIAYALASRIARDVAQHIGDEDDPYGGMGRNGAQHTPERMPAPNTLEPVGGQYAFSQGKVYNLKADEFIKNHGDVTGPQVAYAILHAAKGT